MAQTTGLVQGLLAGDGDVVNGACVAVGPDPANAELVFVTFRPSDTAFDTGVKTAIINALMAAMERHQEVLVTYGDTYASIVGVNIGDWNISWG